MKKCVKCGAVKEATRDCFYAAPRNLDGLRKECKVCTRVKTRSNYKKNRASICDYFRRLEKNPERRRSKMLYMRKSRAKHPEKYRARTAVGNAVRDGKLQRLPCEVCGDPKSQAHHDDYGKPFDVRWLCFRHHREAEHGQTVVTPF